MSPNPKKRTLDTFFSPAPPKKPRIDSSSPQSTHATYPFPIPHLPISIADALGFAPAEEGVSINDRPHLDLLYFKPYVPKDIAAPLFEFLRDELFFYRVTYTIKRGSITTPINTPRYTTVFGVDETARFAADGSGAVVDAKSAMPVPAGYYSSKPRPIPQCLDALRRLTEATTGEKFNFCLVNYYATGDDSISYHSDDERFLGANPAIASFSLGLTRDFLMKHKPAAEGKKTTPANGAAGDVDAATLAKELAAKPLKLALGAGDMVLMRGPTQANWLHSVPKRKGGEVGKGRINITFRRAMVRAGTDNYYQYNVGSGPAFRWNARRMGMGEWKAEDKEGMK